MVVHLSEGDLRIMVYDVAAVVVSVIVLTGVVLAIVAGLCTNRWCCQESIETNSGESRIPAANNYVNYTPGKAEKKGNSGKNRFSRVTISYEDDEHVYEDVTTRQQSKKKEEPCRGYLSMDVLKINPNRESNLAPSCQRTAKSMYISDINLQ